MGVAPSDNRPDVQALEKAGQALVEGDDRFRMVLDALPAAVYTTDAAGRITYFNDAAAQLWGRRPVVGQDLWCGSWKLYWPDGTPMAHDECPMAVTLKTGRVVRGARALAERPDGTRAAFVPYPVPLHDASGNLIGGLNLLVDISDRTELEQRLVAIVENSDDAIASKDLNSVVTSWNRGAERLFGYSAAEMIGKSITILIPAGNENEETSILDRIRRGERVDHYETIRQRKDGTLLNVSLTVSPVRNAEGRIVGASKIARDITERKQFEEQQKLLVSESKHRIKNTLATVQAIAMQTLKGFSTDERKAFLDRIQALAAAQDILTVTNWHQALVSDIVEKVLRPFSAQQHRLRLAGPDVWLNANSSTLLTLALHELATNAVKYGALSSANGRIEVSWSGPTGVDGQAELLWQELDGPKVAPSTRKGFGSLLLERSMGARMELNPDGVVCRVKLTP